MIKLIVLDVDGCLTSGNITYASNDIEIKSFNVKDGLGINTWLKMGNKILIITGKTSKMVQRRAKELGIKHCFQGIKNKEEILKKHISLLGLKNYEVCAIGDDLNDYAMLKLVGKSFTPNDGVDEIKEIVDIVLTRNGGDGAVREMIDIIVEQNDQKDNFLGVWL